MRVKLWNLVLTTIAALAVLAAALVLTVVMLKPGPSGKIVLASGGSEGGYQDLAEAYRAELEHFGVTVDIRPDVEGGKAMQGLMPQFKFDFKNFDEKNADIEAAFIKGGMASSMQGRFASERQQVWHHRLVDDIRSVGRLFYEPLWVFTRADEAVKGLRDLKGKKIVTGKAGSGTKSIARHLLMANGVDEKNSTLVDDEVPADGTSLTNHQIDAVMLFLPPESAKLQELLRNKQLRLLDFSAEADAYTIRFPALSKVVLRQGSVELSPDIPPSDVTLLASSVALVVRSGIDPSLELLLAHAVIANPKPGFDAHGEPILFYAPGVFPTANDPEFQVSPAVRQLYKTGGDLPVLLRSTSQALAGWGLPFWPAAIANEHGTSMVLLIIPALSILLPLFHYLPILYRWGIRRRLLARYRQLVRLEASIGDHPSREEIAEKLRQLDQIDAAVSGASIPLPFTDQVYDLRGHIDLVRRRLEQTTLQADGLTAH